MIYLDQTCSEKENFPPANKSLEIELEPSSEKTKLKCTLNVLLIVSSCSKMLDISGEAGKHFLKFALTLRCGPQKNPRAGKN